MKNFIYLVFINLLFVNCKAQSPIVDIRQLSADTPGTYYKDTHNYFNPFEGTWVYTNNGSTLKFVLQKIVMTHVGDKYYDLIIGEYQYIENGIEKINTLSELNMVYTNQFHHNLSGEHIYFKGEYYKCPECMATDKILRLTLSDDIKHVCYDAFARIIDINGQSVMRIYLTTDGMTYPGGTGDVLEDMKGVPMVGLPTIPIGYYDLTKQ